MKYASFFCVLLALCASCFTRPALMTKEEYDSISVGTSIATVRAEAGEPYAVRILGEGVEEYEYVERISLGARDIAENHYFLTISNGRVIGKRMEYKTPPAYGQIYNTEPNFSVD